MERNAMRSAMLPGRSPEMANSFRRYLEGLFDPRDPSREYGAVLPISSDPNVPGSGRFDLRGGFTGEILALLGAGGRAMRGEAYDPMDITSGMMAVAAPSVAARPSAGVLRSAGGGGAPTENNAMASSIRAYHGSPHNFDRFDLSKVGTGEGRQAFGPGLYFAENENVARGYRDRLALLGSSAARGEGPQGIAARLLDAGLSVDDAIKELNSRLRMPHVQRGLAIRDPNTMAWVSMIAEAKTLLTHPSARGHMYEVNIHSKPEKFIDWDQIGTTGFKPPDALKDLIDNRIKTLYGPTRNSENVSYTIRADATEDVLRNPASLITLRDAGVPGIRYYDAGSRGRGQGSRNYVVFDDNIIEMVRKYGLAGLTMGGAAAAVGGNATPSH